MTVDLEEFQRWRASVEARLDTLEAAADARVLVEHGTRLGSIESRLTEIQEAVDKIHAGVDTIAGTLKSALGDGA